LNHNKTLVVVVNQGFSARYLLRTDIYEKIKKSKINIVILTPNADEEYFKKEFSDENVSIEMFCTDKYEEYLKRHKFQRLLKTIRSFVLNDKYDISTVDDHFKIYLDARIIRNTKDKVKVLLIKFIVLLMKKFRIFRTFVLAIENCLFVPDVHKKIFEKYKPSVLITTSLGNVGNGHDFLILREARRNKVKIMSVILSWDNTSGKGMAAIKPNYIITWTKVMKNELIKLQDFNKKNIYVKGIAHFDIHFQENKHTDRNTIYELLKLDISKKLIFFGTKSPASYPWNCDIIKQIAKEIEKGNIVNSQILVRVHPIHFTNKNGIFRHKEFLDEYKNLSKEFNCVKVNYPEILSNKLVFDMPKSEIILLSSILRYTDVMVNMFSTLSIEAAIHDIPIINVAYEGKVDRKTNNRQSIKIDEIQNHNQRIIRTGGVTNVYSKEELVKEINDSMNKKERKRKERRIIVENECGPNLGCAGNHIGKTIINLIRK